MGFGKPEASSVPEETARVARMAFPKGNPYMRLRDQLGVMYHGRDWQDLFSYEGRPAESAGTLALVTVMQFAEGLSDRQAADAVRGRIDWKYALGLTLTDGGFDASVLSEFRSRILTHGAEERLLDELLQLVQTAGLMAGQRTQRTDSTRILAAVREVNRVELVAATLRHVLEVLAVANPGWLRAQLPADWLDRYGVRLEEYRLPKGKAEREALAVSIGQDGRSLLEALHAEATAPHGLEAVETMRQIWLQQFWMDDTSVHWRAHEDLPPAERLIQSPFDVDARWSYKRSVDWTGYKVHFTETCAQDGPRLITNVQTTPATTPDNAVLDTIQVELMAADRRPQEQIVDAGYVDAGLIVRSQQRGITLVGPPLADTSWQARTPDAYDLTAFEIHWDRKQATCPHGQTSVIWSPSHDSYDNEVIHVAFAREACASCPARTNCTRAKGPRRLKIRPEAEHEALRQARLTQSTKAFRERYRQRAGVEATFSQAVRGFDLRRSPYIGLAKTHLHHVFIAAAMNLTRTACWLAGDRPAPTRSSPLRALIAAAA